jgi:adenine-specific DNA methylase
MFYDRRVDSFANMTHREQYGGGALKVQPRTKENVGVLKASRPGKNKTIIIARKLKRSVGDVRRR